jgi:hypothetical protein
MNGVGPTWPSHFFRNRPERGTRLEMMAAIPYPFLSIAIRKIPPSIARTAKSLVLDSGFYDCFFDTLSVSRDTFRQTQDSRYRSRHSLVVLGKDFWRGKNVNCSWC